MSSKRFQPRTRTLHSAKPATWDALTKEEETDPHKISKRMKQLNFGYNTAGYQRYTASIPKDRRRDTDPTTPNPKWKWSARAWRVLLHNFDPPLETGVIDITGSLKRITLAVREGEQVPWEPECIKFREELGASAQQAGSQAAVHSAYKHVQPAAMMQHDAGMLCVPLQASAAVASVSAALRRSSKRPRKAGGEAAGGPSRPKAPRTT